MAFLKANCPTELEDLIDYFDCNYVDGTFKRIKVPGSTNMKLKMIPPLFSLITGTWNVHIITLDGGHRNNNVCETWNSAFQKLVGQNNPSVWIFIESLQQDFRNFQMTMERIERGEPPEKR